jgi:hypothetical protein
VSTVTSSLSSLGSDFPTADVPLPLGSRTVPGHSYRLLSSTTHNRVNPSEVKLKVTLRLTVSRPVCHGVQPLSGAQDKIFITVRQLRVCWCGAPSLTRGGSVIYNFWWSSPAQPFSSPSPAGLMTIFYCLWFETPWTSRARSSYLYPSGVGWPSYTPRHLVHFSSPPTTRRATLEVFDCAFTRGEPQHFAMDLVIWSRQGPHRKRPFHYCCILSLPWKHACLLSRY